MDILSDIAAVQDRIAQITGTPVGGSTPASAVAFTGALNSALNDRLPVRSMPSNDPIAPNPVPPETVDALVGHNSATWQIDPSLVKAIIANESGFNANATSKVGAQGLMQLMPATAQAVGVKDAYDPAQNVAGGTRYLRGLLDRFNGDVRLAVAAYNAGPGAVEKYGDVPPFPETQNYVQNVLGSYAKYRTTP